jgi:hypothetical protein
MLDVANHELKLLDFIAVMPSENGFLERFCIREPATMEIYQFHDELSTLIIWKIVHDCLCSEFGLLNARLSALMLFA